MWLKIFIIISSIFISFKNCSPFQQNHTKSVTSDTPKYLTYLYDKFSSKDDIEIPAKLEIPLGPIFKAVLPSKIINAGPETQNSSFTLQFNFTKVAFDLLSSDETAFQPIKILKADLILTNQAHFYNNSDILLLNIKFTSSIGIVQQKYLMKKKIKDISSFDALFHTIEIKLQYLDWNYQNNYILTVEISINNFADRNSSEWNNQIPIIFDIKDNVPFILLQFQPLDLIIGPNTDNKSELILLEENDNGKLTRTRKARSITQPFPTSAQFPTGASATLPQNFAAPGKITTATTAIPPIRIGTEKTDPIRPESYLTCTCFNSSQDLTQTQPSAPAPEPSTTSTIKPEEDFIVKARKEIKALCKDSNETRKENSTNNNTLPSSTVKSTNTTYIPLASTTAHPKLIPPSPTPTPTIKPPTKPTTKKPKKEKKSPPHPIDSPSPFACRKYELLVTPADLGLDNVIKPNLLDLGFCAGNCPYPLENDFFNFTVHSYFIDQFRFYRGFGAPLNLPLSHCIPVEYKQLMMISSDDDGGYSVVLFGDASVETCGCR